MENEIEPVIGNDTQSKIYSAFEKIKAKDFISAEHILNSGLQKSEEENNLTDTALFYSAFGVLSKVKGDMKDAWRYYEKAEKLLPTDPSLKIIIAKLLIDKFSQYETAIKKLKDVLRLATESPSFKHQAHAILAIAYLKKGERKKAVEMFDQAMNEDFEGIITCHNLNFEVLSAFVSRSFEIDRCRRYVEKALELAQRRKESKQINFLLKLKESFI